MTHKKRITKILASVLSVVMVFGFFTFLAPDSIVLTANAMSYDGNGVTNFQNGDSIKVTNTFRSSKNEATFTYDEVKGWTTDDSFVWNDGIMYNEFRAWYPATDSTSYDSFKIPTDQAGGVEDADWMTDSTGEILMPNDHKINLTFQHRLAKVTVNITNWNNEFDGSNKTITDPKIYTKGIEVEATYENDGATITATGDITEIAPYVDGTSYTAIVAPAAYNASDKFMTFKVGEQEMTVLATASQLTEGLEPGNHYTFDLTVGKDVVEITEVKVNGWADGGTINGGVAEAVDVTTVINGTTATLIIPELATDALVQEALKELNTDGITTINVDGLLNENRQKYIAEALEGKTVDLYLAQLTEDELIDELKNNDNITVTCGYYIADDSTFVVYTAEGLQEWNTYARTTNPAANLSLKKDVTLPLADGASSNWTSVGTEGTPYIGTVNGNGYSITGMTINQTTQDAGFIGYLGENGWVKNLTLKEVSVTGTMDHIGGFVGRAYHSTVIENCAVESGMIHGNNNGERLLFVGGIVGSTVGSNSSNQETLIIACSNNAHVKNGWLGAGGILGAARVYGGIVGGKYTKIIACYNSGTVESLGVNSNGVTNYKKFGSGIVGDIYNYSTSFYCNYNTGETSADAAIIGRNESSDYGNNYWSSSDQCAIEDHSSRATKITDVSQWESAMATMNTWLAENGYEYRYVINTDAATRDAQPLIIVKAS